MSDWTTEDKLSELSAKIHSLVLGYKIFTLAALLLFSLLNLCAALSISNFEIIFKDALGPDHPLPLVTKIVIGGRIPAICLTLLWPVLGFLAVFKLKKIFHFVIAVTFLLMMVITQLAVTWTSLFMPMTSFITGMADSP